jgi:molybdenum cofactor cytidylyltransferase
MRMSIAAIIVAAGASTRLGQPKQLVMLDGEPLLQRAVRCAREAGAEPVFVVLGAYSDVIEKIVDFGTATIVRNDDWEEGIASSIRAGVKAVNARIEAAGVLLMTCDQPRMTAAHLQKMIELFDTRLETAMIASVYAGARGVPALFPRVLFADLLALRGDKGARGLLAIASLPSVEIQFEGGEVDIDRPEDLAELG